VIATARLILRPWRREDVAPYAAMMADPEVAGPIGGVIDAEEAALRLEAFQAALDDHSLARLAVERRADGRLIGHCGLAPIPEQLPPAPGFEIGWALARDAWGQGYATEAAQAVLADGFDRQGLAEILAFTTVANLRSQAVMGRLGFVRRRELDFDHPRFAPRHPLCRHLVFAIGPVSAPFAAPGAIR
jgi:RimJ/RimL family protein N-acetyltransferase